MLPLLVWWFAYHDAAAYAIQLSVVGPFQTKEQCEQVRAWALTTLGGKASWCWWDGRSNHAWVLGLLIFLTALLVGYLFAPLTNRLLDRFETWLGDRDRWPPR